jgi:uncharacterized protein (DUF58 family)
MLQIEEILRKVKRLEIKSRKAVIEKLSGAYHSTFKGRGIEFLDVRPYQPGDDFRSIDWNVTSRTGELHIKQFFEEREQTIIFAVDVSSSMRFGTKERLKSEAIAEAVALLAFSASMNNDRVGLILFTEDVELYLPPKKKREHILRLVRELLYFTPQKKGTDYDKTLAAIARIFPRKASFFFCSDFLKTPSFNGFKILSKKHDLTLISVGDPAELRLPESGWIEYEDSETSDWGFVNTSSKVVRRKLKVTMESEGKHFLDQTRRANIPVIDLSTESEVLPILEKYFIERSKRRR